MQKQERRITEMVASLSLAQQETDNRIKSTNSVVREVKREGEGDHLCYREFLNDTENQVHERLVARIKKLEDVNAAQNSEIQNLIARIQELNTPPSSPVMDRSGPHVTRSKIVRPVAKKKEKSSTSITSSLWNLFSPTKIFNQVCSFIVL
jgi:hypothetical protein